MKLKLKLGYLTGLGVLIGGVALSPACRTPPSAGLMVESYPKNKITVNSRIVGGWLEVTEVVAAKRNDLLQAQVTALNTTRSDCQFEYRFEWRDKNGMDIPTGMTVFVPVSIAAREKKAMQALAPTKEAEDYVFVVRFRRPSLRWTN